MPQQSAVMRKVKDTKNFAIYQADSPEAPISIATYISKAWLNGAAGVTQIWDDQQVAFQRNP